MGTKEKCIFILLQLIFFYSLSQSRSFIYELKYKPGIEKNNIKRQLYSLDVSKNTSVFRDISEKASDSLISYTGLGMGTSNNIEMQICAIKIDDSPNLKVYKSIKTNFNYYAVKISEDLKWHLSDETKVLNGFKAQKADLNYGGRVWTAWFTDDIPISDGPYIFYGLPGLILQIEDQKKEYCFTLVKTQKETKNFYPRKLGIVMSFDQFSEYLTKYYSDPYFEAKQRGMGQVYTSDAEGKTVAVDMRERVFGIQKNIRNNNPIEINYKRINIEQK
ncbi:MAG: GLPGLI family protein [Flavobacteriaceae bacterium]|jgi:GLPGLI family protein|nr:GLPGLI family protein [Flavobacteriaceae bacterium]